MEYKNSKVGYSGYIIYEECYLYNENACCVSDSHDEAVRFMIDCGYDKSDFRIDEIGLDDLMHDYGYSSGEYAMEKLAFENFKIMAAENEIKYTAEAFYLDPTLMVVNIETLPGSER